MNEASQYQQGAFDLTPPTAPTPDGGEAHASFRTDVGANRPVPGDEWDAYRAELDTRERLGLPEIGPSEYRAILRFMETGEVVPVPDDALTPDAVHRDAEPDGTVFEARRERLNAAIELLAQGIEGITTSEGFRRYLTAMAKFHTYSANNVALILTQDPEATRVMGYGNKAGTTGWKSLGRHVRQGETGITIIRPVTTRLEDEETGQITQILKGFTTAKVFDVRQTEGIPLPERPSIRELSRDEHEQSLFVKTRLMGFLDRGGVTLVRDHESNQRGYWHPGRREIGIRADLTGVTELKTLTHETAHFLADHRGRTGRQDAETVAESTAFVVLNHYGIDTSGYSFPYVAGWAEDAAVLQRNLGEIQTVADVLIQYIGDDCPPGAEGDGGEGGGVGDE